MNYKKPAPSNTSRAKCHTCLEHCKRCDDIWEYEEEHGIDHTPHLPQHTLCWCCKYASPSLEHDKSCPWIDHAYPVNGWDAILHIRDEQICYNVRSCPMFERGGRFDAELDAKDRKDRG